MIMLNKYLLVVLLFLFGNVAFGQLYWGSVYIDYKTGIAGGAYDAASEIIADDVARKSCISKHRGRPQNCRKLTAFANGCTSIYWAPNGVAGYGTTGGSQRDAAARAGNACDREKGRGCRQVLAFCTTIPYY